MKRSTRDAEGIRDRWSTDTTGPSLLESLEMDLVAACVSYLAVKAERERPRGGNVPDDRSFATQISRWRGDIRGLARAVAKIRLPYEDQPATIKQVEKEFIRKARDR